MMKKFQTPNTDYSHNPYFNRWFSAISQPAKYQILDILVTILILIDGFLQLGYTTMTSI